jgi:tetratricopeptide (TPR) repeat protein
MILSLAGFTYAGTPELLFEAGSKAYLEGDWQGAQQHWEKIEASGYHSGALYYNMGNASFKSDELGKAILYWEKAAKLMGEDSDLAANLEIARAKLIDKLDEPVRLPVWDWFDWLRVRFSNHALAYFAIMLCFILFVILALKRWLVRNTRINRNFLLPVWIIVVLLIIDLTLLRLKVHDDLRQREGIVLAMETEVLSAPAPGTGKLLFTLHEGTKVCINRELEEWFEVSIDKERQGWIRKKDLGAI